MTDIGDKLTLGQIDALRYAAGDYPRDRHGQPVLVKSGHVLDLVFMGLVRATKKFPEWELTDEGRRVAVEWPVFARVRQ